MVMLKVKQVHVSNSMEASTSTSTSTASSTGSNFIIISDELTDDASSNAPNQIDFQPKAQRFSSFQFRTK